MKSFCLIFVFFFGLMCLNVSASIEKEIVVNGEAVEISFKSKIPERTHFVQNVLPEIIAKVGDANWYVAEIGYDREGGWDVDAALVIVKMSNGQPTDYWEICGDQYDDLPINMYIDFLLLVADVSAGDMIGTDNSLYDPKYPGHSSGFTKFDLIIDQRKFFKFSVKTGTAH